MSEWRVAESLLQLRTQVNSLFPNREKGWDGTIGDMAHASRTSDHNPWVKDGNTGVVTGEDITNSPKTGPVSQELAAAPIKSHALKHRKVKVAKVKSLPTDAGES